MNKWVGAFTTKAMCHHLQLAVIYSTCSLENISDFLTFVLCDCLDCLDKTTALARSFLSLTQSCPLTICKGSFCNCRGILFLSLLAQTCVLCRSFDLQILYCKRVLKELWYIVGLLLCVENPNFSKLFSLWHLWRFGNKQCLIYGITGGKIKRKPKGFFCIAVASSWDQQS